MNLLAGDAGGHDNEGEQGGPLHAHQGEDHPHPGDLHVQPCGVRGWADWGQGRWLLQQRAVRGWAGLGGPRAGRRARD